MPLYLPARVSNNFLSLSMLSMLVKILQSFRCALTSRSQSFTYTNLSTSGFSGLGPQAPPTSEAKLQNDILFRKVAVFVQRFGMSLIGAVCVRDSVSSKVCLAVNE